MLKHLPRRRKKNSSLEPVARPSASVNASKSNSSTSTTISSQPSHLNVEDVVDSEAIVAVTVARDEEVDVAEEEDSEVIVVVATVDEEALEDVVTDPKDAHLAPTMVPVAKETEVPIPSRLRTRAPSPA